MARTDNKTFYNTSLEKYGKSAQGVRWNSQKSQFIRFKILVNFLPKEIDRLSIVDAGCGFGDLYLYLKEEYKAPKSYVGLEMMQEMITEAKVRTGCEIYDCDILKDKLIEADYYVCSGAMNILTCFETTLFISRCFKASKKGFIFNLLEGEDESLVYNYFLPKEIKKIAKELGATIKIKKGYLERDFSVAFYK